MNIKEADLSYLASPADPIGLEISGSETSVNITETQIISENAGGIVLYGRFRDGIRKLADYTGEVGRKISPRNLAILGGIGVIALYAACGGGAEANATNSSVETPTPFATGETILATQNPTVAVVAPALEVKVAAPVVAATEVAKVEKTAVPVITVLDKPVTKVTIDQLRNEAITAYDAKTESFKESDGTIYPKAYLEGGLKSCEKGSPDSAGLPKFVAQERLGSCAGIVRGMVVWYKNNGDPALMQIAVDARSYFVTQYPELKGQFDSFLKQAGVN